MPNAGTIAACERAQRYSPRPLTAGERWTVEALADLRGRGYCPGAWVVFLRSSLERSRIARSQRPGLARQVAAAGVAGGAGWWAAWFVARRRSGVDLPLFAGLAWWLAVWRMLDWHLGMAEGGDGRARTRLSPADGITLMRFWLVPALPAVARDGALLPVVIVFGGVTDWLDGIVARRYGRTRLGRDLDTTADLAFSGLALAAAGRPRSGTLLLLAGCLVPPRSTLSLSPV